MKKLKAMGVLERSRKALLISYAILVGTAASATTYIMKGTKQRSTGKTTDTTQSITYTCNGTTGECERINVNDGKTNIVYLNSPYQAVLINQNEYISNQDIAGPFLNFSGSVDSEGSHYEWTVSRTAE